MDKRMRFDPGGHDTGDFANAGIRRRRYRAAKRGLRQAALRELTMELTEAANEHVQTPEELEATCQRVEAYVASRPGLREKLDAYKKAELERAPHEWVFDDGQCVQGDLDSAELWV